MQQLKGGASIEAGKKVLKAKTQLPEHIESARQHISNLTGQKVQLSYGSNGKGKLTIPFASEDELNRILALIKE